MIVMVARSMTKETIYASQFMFPQEPRMKADGASLFTRKSSPHPKQ
jgi:hypothetical protein